MILGLVLFLGIHVLSSLRDLRGSIVNAMGEGAYKASIRWYRSPASP